MTDETLEAFKAWILDELSKTRTITVKEFTIDTTHKDRKQITLALNELTHFGQIIRNDNKFTLPKGE